MIEFPVSGVETYWWLPILFAFVVSCLTSTAGISGAFLLLPFQVSILGFTSPGVTPTNLLYNTVAIPSGIYRNYREKRMVWPLVKVISTGTIPGLVLGVFIRVRYLPDPVAFKFFVGLVLVYIAIRLLMNTLKKQESAVNSFEAFEVSSASLTFRKISFVFNGQQFSLSTPVLFTLSIIVGAIGGIYGIGGGAILAPILVIMFRLPIYTISGATLFGTFLSSTVGVLFYIVLAPLFAADKISAQPDWMLGLMFGIGGSLGIYLGTRIQKYIPARLIKILLLLIMLYVAIRYIIGFFAQ
ncbi:MAG: sulfite exporter TauE/SafE family protein [candidate division Zixibacteria bacterium]